MDTPLENETLNIYRREIENLSLREPKYKTLGTPEIQTIVHAFELTLTHGKDKVRAQMLYDLIHNKRQI